MTETDFQALFDQYAQTKMPSLRENAVIRLHEHIYRYARRRFRMSDDVSSDFYLHYQDKIEDLFKDYDPERGLSFLVFVTVRLRYAFYKFLGRRRLPRGSASVVNDYADWEEEAKLTGAYDEPDRESEELKSARQSLELLDREKQILLRLYFGFPLKHSQVRELVKQRGDLSFLRDYRKFLENHRQAERAQKSEFYAAREKLGKLHLEKMAGKEIKNYEEKRAKLAETLNKQKNPVSQRDLAALVGKNLSTVHRRIKEALDELRESLKLQ